jgi:hypothetical protein
LNISIGSGISIPRWSQAVNVLIEKDAGRPRINGLRIVHLFEADFNFLLKLQWGHRLVCQALLMDLLHKGQHGSIPGRMALDPIILTQLSSDLCRVLKHDFARFDNDASSRRFRNICFRTISSSVVTAFSKTFFSEFHRGDNQARKPKLKM